MTLPPAEQRISDLVHAKPEFARVDPTYLALAMDISTAMNVRGYALTIPDVLSWFSDDFDPLGGDSFRVTVALAAFMGPHTVDYYDNLSRLDNAVCYHLGISSDRYIGGVDVSLSWLGRNPGDRPFSIVDLPYPPVVS